MGFILNLPLTNNLTDHTITSGFELKIHSNNLGLAINSAKGALYVPNPKRISYLITPQPQLGSNDLHFSFEIFPTYSAWAGRMVALENHNNPRARNWGFETVSQGGAVNPHLYLPVNYNGDINHTYSWPYNHWYKIELVFPYTDQEPIVYNITSLDSNYTYPAPTMQQRSGSYKKANANISELAPDFLLIGAMVDCVNYYTNTTAAAGGHGWTYYIRNIEYRINGVQVPKISGNYTSTSGLNYYYRTKFIQNPNEDNTSNVVNYVTEWGLDTNYGNTYSSKNYTFTESNASNSVTLLTNAANTEIDALKTKFDTYIGPVTPPGEKKGEYTAVNGIKYYWKTTFTGSNTSLTAQTATITVTTVWGKTNTYGNTFTNGNHIIKPNNYATYQADLETLANTQKGNLQMQLDRYIGDVTAPTEVKGSVVATNGITYYYKTSYSGASSSLTATSCPISVVTDWGTSTSYGTKYTSESFTIIASNYKTRTTDLQNVAKRHLANLTNYLNTLISTISIPAVKSEEWSTNTGKVYIKTTYTKKSESATEYVMYYKTEWGLTNSYGNVFVNNATISINANNYKTRETVFTNYHNAAVANLKKRVSFLNASTPAAISNSYKAKNGITYYYKQTWAFVSRDISKSVYRLTTTYGTASNANTTTNYDSTTTLNVNVDNIANVSNAFSTLANTKKEQLCAYLDTLIINVTAPAAVANTFAATNGLTYAYRTTFTLSNKTNSEVTVTVKTEWGKNTTYGNTFATSVYKITSANQQTFANQNETIRQDHVTKLQAFLNKLIDTVTFGAKTSTYEASNGTMYYIRTRVEGKSVTYAS